MPCEKCTRAAYRRSRVLGRPPTGGAAPVAGPAGSSLSADVAGWRRRMTEETLGRQVDPRSLRGEEVDAWIGSQEAALEELTMDLQRAVMLGADREAAT